ncbi:hypothetical protein [Thetidibacter halocola]|uniref:Succinate dehydrogenase n=1 Tax=Thetidibacter halocola TaxID=2827239 RepID=A0A8J7WFC9_9RHOB|nr:hypothetical protein [Thetidibacter halocola]MBS0124671.1 hypothetical protein [Thetidibacter halocola]
MRVGLALMLLLAACTPQAQDQLAREAARSAITPIVAQRFPGIPVQPAIDCIIDNASAPQISALAADSVLGPNENTARIVSDIVSQPGTLTCLGTQGLPALLR